jgi:hypothetical protein
MRYWDLCQPCQVRYDFIGTAENYAEEAELFVKKMNITVTFPDHEQKVTHESSLGKGQNNLFDIFITCSNPHTIIVFRQCQWHNSLSYA